jgi:hypothetical protein
VCLGIFQFFKKHCLTLTLKKLERMPVVFEILKVAPIDRFHNGFLYKVVDKFLERRK